MTQPKELTLDLGTFRVWSDSLSADVHDVRLGRVVKRFSGETAWSDAERWAHDRYFAEMYGR